jgi:putative DNA primase/helicase
VPAGDFALWQRIHLIPFTISFVDNPKKPNERKADPDLPQKLRAEASGILAWLVRGCLDWQRIGLNPPEAVLAATRDYQAEEDILGHFIDDRCILGDSIEVKSSALYKAYVAWCDENGHKPISGTRFGKEIKTMFDSYKSGAGYIHYIGIGLLKE